MCWDTAGTSVNFLITDDHVECICSSAFTVHAYFVSVAGRFGRFNVDMMVHQRCILQIKEHLWWCSVQDVH